MQHRGWEVLVVVHEEVADQVPKTIPTASAERLPWSWDEELSFRRSLWDPSPPSDSQAEAQQRKAELSERYFLGSQRSLALGLNVTLQAIPRERWPVLLVVDVSSVGAMDIAELYHLSYAVMSPWPVGPTLQSIGDPAAFAHPWMPSELFASPQSADQQEFFDRLKRMMTTTLLPKLMAFMGFNKPRQALRNELGLGGSLELLEVPRWAPQYERPLVLVLSHWGLDRARPLPANVQLVGPVVDYSALAAAIEPLPEAVRRWLSQRPGPVVYVSFGTNVQARPRMLREMLKGMAELERDGISFLWDMEEAALEDEVAVDGFEGAPAHAAATVPDNVLFAPRVSQLAVLAGGHARVFVTHCGLNSVHEALHFGVPMAGLPFLGDQLITAFLIEEAGAGMRLSVPRLSAFSFAEALRPLVSEDAYREAAARAGSVARRAGGAVAAADALEVVIETGVSHLQMLSETRPGSTRVWDVVLVLTVGPVVALALLCYGLAAIRKVDEGLAATAEAASKLHSGAPTGKAGSGGGARKKQQ